MNNTKKISYLSAIMIVVGSTIGAGIFFKNGSIFVNSHGSLGLTIASWLVAAFGILMIGLALIELSSASKKDRGILEWAKNFMPKSLSKYSTNYMLLIYLPLTYFMMPIYAVMSLQDATNNAWTTNAWVVGIIAFGFFAWIATMGYLSTKVSEGFNWIFTIAKFIPLFIAPFLTIDHYESIREATGSTGLHAKVAENFDKFRGGHVQAIGLTQSTGWLGIMASIPAILFAYDGFYAVTALKSKVKDEKKMGAIVAIGLALITAGYLFFVIFTGIYGQKNIFGPYSKTITSFFNAMIMIAILGIANGFAMGAPKIYEESYEAGDFALLKWFKEKLNIKSFKQAAFFVVFIFSALWFIVLVPVSTSKGIEDAYGGDYGETAGKLYGIVDMISNYTSLAVFIIIGGALIGGIMNRKTNKVQVKHSKLFLITAWISVIFLAIGTIYYLADNFAIISGFQSMKPDDITAHNDALLEVAKGNLTMADVPVIKDYQVDAAVKMGILIFTLIISAVPLIIESIINKKRTQVKTA